MMPSLSIAINLTTPKHTIDPKMMKKITKVQALQQFRHNWNVHIKQQPKWKDDVIAKREGWNNFVDALNKEGWVNDHQAMNWSNPF